MRKWSVRGLVHEHYGPDLLGLLHRAIRLRYVSDQDQQGVLH
jgi:hypothetical protein